MFKVKVDGQEIEVPESEMVNNYQLRKAADKKMQEAAQMRKQAETFVEMLRTDPIKVLSNPNLGVNFRELAEQYLVEQMQEDMLDPKDKELREYKRRVEEIESRERQEQQRVDSERVEMLKSKYTESYSQQITEALSEGGLPRTPETVRKIAHYLHLGLQSGIELTAKDVIPYVKNDYIKAQKELFGSTSEDLLLELMGDELAGKLRKADLKRLKGSQPISTPTKQGHKEGGVQPVNKKISKDDWKTRMEKIKNGLED
jgi:hypothetical protein